MSPRWPPWRRKRLRASSLSDDPIAAAVREACAEAHAAGAIKVKSGVAVSPDRLLDGYCYILAEAYYHLRGDRESELQPTLHGRGNEGHWWLQEPGDSGDPEDVRIVDLIAESGERVRPYENGKRSQFRTRSPSQRADAVMRRAQAKLERQH
jgi:hypothetical protein